MGAWCAEGQVHDPPSMSPSVRGSTFMVYLWVPSPCREIPSLEQDHWIHSPLALCVPLAGSACLLGLGFAVCQMGKGQCHLHGFVVRVNYNSAHVGWPTEKTVCVIPTLPAKSKSHCILQLKTPCDKTQDKCKEAIIGHLPLT